MRADHAGACIGEWCAPDAERDEAAAVPHDPVLPARLQLPAVALVELGEPGVRQPSRHLRDGVERGGGDVDERAQVGAEGSHEDDATERRWVG